jgi:glycosyltransferase involved in cell wall biosynthesis
VSGVSAILAVCNGEPYLREAVDSMLGQSVPPDEIIVVDDGSTDATPAILDSYGDALIRYRQDNAGQASAIVAGIARASGAFLSFQDADDVWMPDKTERQLAALAADPGLDAVFGMSEQFVSPELPEADRLRLTPPRAVLVGEIAGCMTIRRTAYDRVGGFGPGNHGAYFIDWLGRTRGVPFRSAILDEVVTRRRLHLNNYGRVQTIDRDRNLLSALRRHLTRRETGGG